MSLSAILTLAVFAGTIIVRLYFLFTGRMPHETQRAKPARASAHVSAAHRYRATPRHAGAALPPPSHNAALGIRLHARRRPVCHLRLAPASARGLSVTQRAWKQV